MSKPALCFFCAREGKRGRWSRVYSSYIYKKSLRSLGGGGLFPVLGGIPWHLINVLSPVTCTLSESKPQDLPSLDPVHLSTCNAGVAGDIGSIPRWKDPLEEEMTTHSSILAWRIPWAEKPGRLQSMESQRVRHDLVTEHIHFCAVFTSEVSHVHVSDLGCYVGNGKEVWKKRWIQWC